MLLGMIILAIELPLPAVKKFSFYRSLVVRIVLLLFQVFLTILFYQVRPFIFDLILPSIVSQGTNAALWSLIAAVCYGRGIMLGEEMTEAKENRGKGGGV